MTRPTCIRCGVELKLKAACICEKCARKEIPPNLSELLTGKE